MILAEKMIRLRKKAGWSQEELAAQLGVTRQSVSKWEGAQSVPDVDKVLQLSRLFGVSTDYLLKDEMEEADVTATQETEGLRRVTLEEASAYLALRKNAAPKMALATFLCVVSPIPLLALSGLSQRSATAIGENAAAGLGLCALLVLVALAVVLFLRCASQAKEYAFLADQPFETAYGVEGMVKERRRAYRDTYSRLCITGTVLCILSAVPLVAACCISAGDLWYIAAVCVLLLMVAIGCYALVYGGAYQAAMDKLLEEGDYSRGNKARKDVKKTISLVYWLAATAVFLVVTFGPSGNGNPQYSWIVWAVAGVLYGAVMGVASLLKRKE